MNTIDPTQFSLKPLTLDDGIEIYEMLQALPKDDNGFHNMFNGLTFEAFKQELVSRDKEARGIDLAEGKVPQGIYWFYVDDKPAGMVKIRHYLNEALRENGGHVGYALSPKFRGNGYGSKMLELAIAEARKLGIEDVLVVCNPDNLASKAVIFRNGGVLEKHSETDALYWISYNK